MSSKDNSKSDIEFNDQFTKALELMENSAKNIFLTGKAGTGKSTLLDYFRNNTKKKVAVLAPTGVAAINVRGQTIHSFFRFKPDITLEAVKKRESRNGRDDIYKKIDTIVIDEISMVRADLLDCVDKFLRLNGPKKDLPFGGIQMIFIGDLYQLPPVVTGEEREIFKTHYASPYFFNAKVLDYFPMEFVELEKIYRQKDTDFINLLNGIRNNSVSDEQLKLLNQRVDMNFNNIGGEFYICLTTTNQMADEINQVRLHKLPGKIFHYQGMMQGDFEKQYLPTEINLSVKVGAQVMMLNNDQLGRWVNGTMGKIVGIERQDTGEDDLILVEMENGEVEEVVPYTWEIFKFNYNERSQSLESETVGSFTQYPLKLAWAVTIHKSQGKTFDKVIIDIGRGTFAHGQMYVALSRCRTLGGMVLKKPILKKHILMDFRVIKFLTKYQYSIADKKLPLEDKLKIIEQAVKEGRSVEVVYLKSNDEKSKRVISPNFVGEMEYSGKTYLGFSGFDSKRGEDRTFRVDRILEMKVVS